jgi:hypothetical protein
MDNRSGVLCTYVQPRADSRRQIMDGYERIWWSLDLDSIYKYHGFALAPEVFVHWLGTCTYLSVPL